MFAKFVKGVGAVGVNVALVGGGLRQERENRALFFKMPVEERKKLHNACPLNHLSHDGSAWSVVRERMADPAAYTKDPLNTPFKPGG
ncbi:MAG: hypothetical protein H0U71_07550 [Gammaproteobacteria bacterium]|nr:hypothetical protein [Gammaproteobacteria bacterium]